MTFTDNIFFTPTPIYYLSLNPVLLSKGIFHQVLNLQATPKQSQTKNLFFCDWFSEIKDKIEPNYKGLFLT
jgi:hypothetical protein